MSPTSVNTPAGASSPPNSTEAVIDKFLDSIWMERGLSANTLGAYRADLLALQRWLTQRDKSLIYASRADLLAFIAWRAKEGAKPRSTARQLSSFRRFYRFLLREGMIAEDPTLKIDMPKIGRALPQSLTESEVDSLLSAPDVTDPIHPRQMIPEPSGSVTRFRDDAPARRTYIAFSGSGFPLPRLVGRVSNQDLHRPQVVGMIILSSATRKRLTSSAGSRRIRCGMRLRHIC